MCRKRFLRDNEGEKGQPQRQHPRIDGASSSSKSTGSDAASSASSPSLSKEHEKTAKKVVKAASSSSQGKGGSKTLDKLATLSEGKDAVPPEAIVKEEGFLPVREGTISPPHVLARDFERF